MDVLAKFYRNWSIYLPRTINLFKEEGISRTMCAPFRLLKIKNMSHMGAFHWTKYSGLKFRVFYVTNETVFSDWFGLICPRSSGSKFRAKIRIKSNWVHFAFLTCLLAFYA